MRALTPTSSPLSSPSKHGDRFIPSRAGANWSVNFHRINVSHQPHTSISLSLLRTTVFKSVDYTFKEACFHFSTAYYFFVYMHLNRVEEQKAFTVMIFYYIFFWHRKLKSHTIKIGKPKMGQQTATKVIKLPSKQKAIKWTHIHRKRQNEFLLLLV